MAYRDVEVGKAPVFAAVSATVPEDAKVIEVALAGVGDIGERQVEVYWDGLVLAEGEYFPDEAPRFADVDARFGTWGGQPFVN